MPEPYQLFFVVGYVIGLALFTLLTALYLKLCVRWFSKQTIRYWKAYLTCILGFAAQFTVGLLIGFAVGFAEGLPGECTADESIMDATAISASLLLCVAIVALMAKVDMARAVLITFASAGMGLATIAAAVLIGWVVIVANASGN